MAHVLLEGSWQEISKIDECVAPFAPQLPQPSWLKIRREFFEAPQKITHPTYHSPQKQNHDREPIQFIGCFFPIPHANWLKNGIPQCWGGGQTHTSSKKVIAGLIETWVGSSNCSLLLMEEILHHLGSLPFAPARGVSWKSTFFHRKKIHQHRRW